MRIEPGNCWEMAQAYAPQAGWNDGNASGSLCNELKSLSVGMNECRTAYCPVCADNEIIHDVSECKYI